jgi:hypothetical protein
LNEGQQGPALTGFHGTKFKKRFSQYCGSKTSRTRLENSKNGFASARNLSAWTLQNAMSVLFCRPLLIQMNEYVID